MNDVIYNEIVATPGFELEFAVGTTYSLDAEIFLALAMAFSRLGDAVDADFQNPMRLLEGLRQVSKRSAIFCNRGGLHPPLRKNPLFAMLDKCVFEVANSKEPLANFHPKLWIIKERSLSDRTFRQIKLIVLSRNLTNDGSLDIAVSMTAPLGANPDPLLRRKHEPLKRMLEELSAFASADKRKEIKRLARDFDSMGPFELDSRFVDYDFIPISFGKNLNPDVDFRKELPGQKMIIVSPFLDKSESVSVKGTETPTPVNWLNGFSPRDEKVLVTRLESLTPEIMNLYSVPGSEVWVMSQIAEQNDIQPMNLHAKIYFSLHPRQGGVYLWLGSANATHSGFYRNSEFLLRLSFRRGKNQFQDFKAEFCDEKKQLCQRVTSLPEEAEPEGDSLSLAIKVRRNLICPNNLSAEVFARENGYEVRITARKIKDIPGVITLAPIQQPGNTATLSPEGKECAISVAKGADLSEFYILSVTPFEGIESQPVKLAIKIPTKGIPADRDDRIFRSLLDTRDKFLNYVEMMITDRPMELGAILGSAMEAEGNTGPAPERARTVALYESLLRIAASNPEKLEDIRDLVGRLDSDVVPPSFIQMAEMFKNLRK